MNHVFWRDEMSESERGEGERMVQVRDPKPPEGLLEDDMISVTTPYGKVSLDGGRVLVKDADGNEAGRFPVEQVSTLNVFGSATVTTPLLEFFSQRGMVVNYFTQFGRYLGSFYPGTNTIALVRRHQTSIPADRALAISRALIYAKLQNGYVFLTRKKQSVPDLFLDLRDRCRHAGSMDSLRGIEGEAARVYFSALSLSFPDDWRSPQRSRRPPRDELNALLSLTYTMVTTEVISALRQCNLDPFLGIMHTDRHGKPALALDLIEEFRPVFCDAFVSRLIHKKMVSREDFTQASRLTEAAFKKYLGYYHEFMKESLKHPRFAYTVSRKRVIQIQAILLRKAICGELAEYHPFVYTR